MRSNVDLIVAPANTAAVAAKAATSSIPIVMIFPVDPVGLGLVASLSRPGGNVTGTASVHSAEIFGKQLQTLKEVVPNATRFARLSNPAAPIHESEVKEVDRAAQILKVRLQQMQARGPEEFDKAFAAVASERVEALMVSNDSTFLVNAARIAELALKYRLPTMCRYREIVEAGGLMSYWVNMADFIGRSATYVDRILRGAKLGDLPAEQPTLFELVINLKTAKALGLTISKDVLLRADEVIR